VRVRSAVLATAVLLLDWRIAIGQTVQGITTQNDRPVPGVVVLLVDSLSKLAGRSLTTEQGEFRITAPRPGTYRLRTLRIGFRPVLSETFVLAAGAVEARRVALVGVPIQLEAMRVVDRSECRAFTDSGATVFSLWEQVRGALIAAQLTAEGRSIAATTITIDQVRDPASDRVVTQHAKLSSGYVSRPWRTIAPDSLHRLGYVATTRDGSIEYNAPGLDMLVSNVFVEDHCFRAVDGGRTGQLGIAFEPTPERKRGVAEIRGTLWVDRATSELKRLEFRYVNVTSEQESFARGELGFVRLRGGGWAVDTWRIRMPVVEQVVRPGHGAEPRVTAIQVAGGELAIARRGADTLWARPRFSVNAIVRDSVTGAAVAGARLAGVGGGEHTSDARGHVSIPDLLPGEYTIELRTPPLDSLNTAHRVGLVVIDSSTTIELRVPNARAVASAICGADAAARSDGSGIVVGRARLASGDSPSAGALSGARINAEWHASAEADRVQRLQAQMAADGAFRICGLPLNADVALDASATGFGMSRPSTVRPTSAVRLVRAELALEPVATLAARGATFTGVVVFDSTKAPVEGAEVALPELRLSARTDAMGAFRIGGIAAGEHRVSVRHVGFGAADTRVVFQESETVERRVVLGRAVVLEAMTISERMNDRYMPGFEENRRLGLGHFMTRAELEKYTGMKLLTALQNMTPSFRAILGRGGAFAYPISNHTPPVHACPKIVSPKDCAENQGAYWPDDSERRQGIIVACYALVYLDGVLMNGAKEPTEPFDISTIAPERVEAVEFYSGPAQTPLKYSRMSSRCGVLVIWTRRSH
jgi:Carboxypeptidase regulatory-like domain